MGSLVVVLGFQSTGSIIVVLGLVALQHVGSSQTRGLTCVSCIGRQILYLWTTKEAPSFTLKILKVVILKVSGYNKGMGDYLINGKLFTLDLHLKAVCKTGCVVWSLFLLLRKVWTGALKNIWRKKDTRMLFPRFVKINLLFPVMAVGRKLWSL